MNGQKSGTPSQRALAGHDTYGYLMLQAAGVLRRRYVEGSKDTSLSPAAANELARVFEGAAHGDPAFDQIDPNVAIALANRLIDDDHPEQSEMWPRTR